MMTYTEQTLIDTKERLAQLFGEFADGTYSSNGTIIDGTRVDDIVDLLVDKGVRIPVLCKCCCNCTRHNWCNLLMMDVKEDGFCNHGKRRQ